MVEGEQELFLPQWFFRNAFFIVMHVNGWICGISILITMYDILELHDYLSQLPFSLSLFRVQSLSHQSIPLSFSLSVSLSKVYISLSFPLSLTSFFWLFTNLISISFVLWTSLYKDLYIFKQKFEWVNEMQTVNITFV